MEQGFTWHGISGAEVVRFPDGLILIGIPLLDPSGEEVFMVNGFGQFWLAYNN